MLGKGLLFPDILCHTVPVKKSGVTNEAEGVTSITIKLKYSNSTTVPPVWMRYEIVCLPPKRWATKI